MIGSASQPIHHPPLPLSKRSAQARRAGDRKAQGQRLRARMPLTARLSFARRAYGTRRPGCSSMPQADPLFAERKSSPIQQLQADIGLIERRLSLQMREMPACKAVAEIPGIGSHGNGGGRQHGDADSVLGCAGVCSVGRIGPALDRYRWTSQAARDQQAWRCLSANAPHARRSSRRDQSKDRPTWPWLAALLQRRPYSVAVAAVANKLARTVWAVLARGQAWRPEAWQAVRGR